MPSAAAGAAAPPAPAPPSPARHPPHPTTLALALAQFARLIGTREHAEHLWRITKEDGQHSTVLQEDIID